MLLEILIIVEVVLIISVIFFERKKPSVALSWILVILFLPGIGYLLYLILGETWSKKRAKKLKEKALRETYQDDIYFYAQKIAKNNPVNNLGLGPFKSLLEFNNNYSKSIFTKDNSIEVFTWGEDKFDRLFYDIDKAKNSIHILYFKIVRDNMGKELLNRLTEKAKQGVEVRVIYDGIGSLTPKYFFNKLLEAGGQVYCYEESIIKNFLRINFRNHRKIAVIDGTIAYTGGMNISDSYVGKHKIKTPWRDTHLRITGSSVLLLQFYFLQDWARLTKDISSEIPRDKIGCYFPLPQTQGVKGMQVVVSGADTDEERIKLGFIKMISSAKEDIQIQTPYFIPDETIMKLLKIAIFSGVKVQIMIPEVPSSWFLNYTTLSYVSELVSLGAEVYRYKGYLHAKTLVVDGKVCSIGSTNMDIRSFRLSDEVNMFIFDKDFSSSYQKIFEKDISDSNLLTIETINKFGLKTKFLGYFLRLFSPLM